MFIILVYFGDLPLFPSDMGPENNIKTLNMHARVYANNYAYNTIIIVIKIHILERYVRKPIFVEKGYLRKEKKKRKENKKEKKRKEKRKEKKRKEKKRKEKKRKEKKRKEKKRKEKKRKEKKRDKKKT